jgi:glutamate/tyrosine decarboxylase-like PLP-dependent enzyme
VECVRQLYNGGGTSRRGFPALLKKDQTVENSSISILEKDSLCILRDALDRLEAGFSSLPPASAAVPDTQPIERVILEVAERLRDNYPYFHPLYAGQMLKPPHPVARLASMLAMWINPNNHALDGGRASSRMEKEAVSEIAAMLGWETYLGHLTSGGTMANLEALWVANRLSPASRIVASEQAHYTHSRISAVLKLKYKAIPCDRWARLDLEALKRRLDRGGIGTVVATIGTTATGSIDPLPELLDLREHYGFRIHADSAYGGYFRLADNLTSETRRVYDLLPEVDSIVIDPHKHGLQPYGCGCVLFKDPSVGRFYKHDSPYSYFSSNELHLGEISLECSRAGAAAVGLWATQKLLPLAKGGEFARGLQSSREAALELYLKLRADPRFLTAFAPELDIVIWAPQAARVSQACEIARQIFAEAEQRQLYLALANLPVKLFDLHAAHMEPDRNTITCLRSVLMKPEHREWVDTIWSILDQATNAALQLTAGT